MGKRALLTIIFATGLLFSCKAQTTQLAPTPTLTPSALQPSATVTVGPLTISGEFVLTNTSAPGTDVGIETMEMVLEYRLSTSDPWEKVETDCIFDPPAPLVLNEELVIQYECSYTKLLPPNAQIRTTAEVRIFGSDEVFRLEVEPP